MFIIELSTPSPHLFGVAHHDVNAYFAGHPSFWDLVVSSASQRVWCAQRYCRDVGDLTRLDVSGWILPPFSLYANFASRTLQLRGFICLARKGFAGFFEDYTRCLSWDEASIGHRRQVPTCSRVNKAGLSENCDSDALDMHVDVFIHKLLHAVGRALVVLNISGCYCS